MSEFNKYAKRKAKLITIRPYIEHTRTYKIKVRVIKTKKCKICFKSMISKGPKTHCFDCRQIADKLYRLKERICRQNLLPFKIYN